MTDFKGRLGNFQKFMERYGRFGVTAYGRDESVDRLLMALVLTPQVHLSESRPAETGQSAKVIEL